MRKICVLRIVVVISSSLAGCLSEDLQVGGDTVRATPFVSAAHANRFYGIMSAKVCHMS